MKFEELDIKATYDSRRTSVYDEFFNKVLPNSSLYKRFAGFFSAKRFALTAEGLQEFIKENNGMMELVMIPSFTTEETDAILKGISADEIITKNWIRDLSEIKEKFVEDHAKALSWMIANQYLTIKLLVPYNKDGKIIPIPELNQHSLLHKEIGIMYDKETQKPISFHGLIDRDSGESDEIYAIDVFRDWKDNEHEKIESDFAEFSDYWKDAEIEINEIKFKKIPLGPQLEQFFNDYAPKSKAEINLKKPPILRDYQKIAISNWIENNFRGIFEMATGTGKTFTAIGSLKKVEEKEEKLLVVITVPYNHLIQQWESELLRWNIKSKTLDESTWRITLRDEVRTLNYSTSKSMSVVIVSHVLFKDENFVKQIEKSKVANMVIVDEAHHIGTETSIEALSPNYHYRLALSATINRYYDDDGTEEIKKFFGNNGTSTVFEFTLEKAIKEGKLCSYYYYPYFIELNAEEEDQYRELSYKLAKYLHSKDPGVRKMAEPLLNKRAKIIRDAENKKFCFEDILKDMKSYSRLLIFCSENQFKSTLESLDNFQKITGVDKSLMYRKITYDDPKSKSDRVRILKEFADEKWDMILANKVLDEGMDIPQAQNSIILASTGNPTTFVQRRGRVLRIYDDTYKDGTKKEFATIYDVLVKPVIISTSDPEIIKTEISMIRSQLERIKDMSRLAINKEQCEDKIKEFTYGLPDDVFRIS